jgi:hypothetical protein
MANRHSGGRYGPLLKGTHGAAGLVILAVAIGAFYAIQLMMAEPEDLNSYSESASPPSPGSGAGLRSQAFLDWLAHPSAAAFTVEIDERGVASLAEILLRSGVKNGAIRPRVKLAGPDVISLIIAFRLRYLGGRPVYVGASGRVKVRDGKIIVATDEVIIGRLRIGFINGTVLLRRWLNIAQGGTIPLPEGITVESLSVRDGLLTVTIDR